MKRSFLALACAGSFLATFTSESVAQIGGPYVYNPTPTPIPDAPEATRPGNGGYMASFPGYKPPPKDTNVYPPTISGARMFNGRLRFTFTGSSPTTLRYIIGWSRPGLAEVSDMRWTGPRHEAGRVIEEYIINEKPVPDTVYNFRVQAQGKNKINGKYPLTKFVDLSFRTPKGLSLADKIKIGEKHGPSTSRPSKSDPYGLNRVETSVRLNPLPPIGPKVVTPAPYSRLGRVSPVQTAPLLRLAPLNVRPVR